eukprot:2638207-Pleurochrysis_carterae.AAC.1
MRAGAAAAQAQTATDGDRPMQLGFSDGGAARRAFKTRPEHARTHEPSQISRAQQECSHPAFE